MTIDVRLTYRVDEAAAETGLSRATLYRLARRNELEMIKVLGRTLIEGSELVAMIERMKATSRASASARLSKSKRAPPPARGDAPSP